MYCMYLYPSEFPIRSGCLSALLAADAKPQPNAFTSAAMPEHFTCMYIISIVLLPLSINKKEFLRE